MKPVTKKQIDAVLVFLDGFEAEGFSAGTWSNEQGMMPYFMMSDEGMAFNRALYDNGWVIRGFGWPKWKHAAEGYVASPDTIATADVGTIQKLFTTHVR